MGSSGSMGTGMGISMSAELCIGRRVGVGRDVIGKGGFGEVLVFCELWRTKNYRYILDWCLDGIRYIWVSGVGMGMVYGTSRMIPPG